MINDKKHVYKHMIKFYLSFLFGTIYNIYLINKIFFLFEFLSIQNIILISFIITSIFFLSIIIFNYISQKIYIILYYYYFFILSVYFFFCLSSVLMIFIILFLGLNNILLNFIVYIIFGSLLMIFGIYSKNNTILEKNLIKVKNLKNKIKFAHLTDMHLGIMYGRNFVEKLIKLIKNEKNIEFIVITGDIVDGNIKLSEEMLKPFNSLNIPIYYITGNHEEYTNKKENLEIIHNSKLKHLQNTFITINNNINLIGIDFNWNIYESKQELIKIRNLIKNSNPNILLYHSPIFKENDLQTNNIFLFLCGHTHGGQIFPLHILYKFKFGVLDGLYEFTNNIYIYCCSGCGTSWGPVRFLTKSKIGIIELIPKN